MKLVLEDKFNEIMTQIQMQGKKYFKVQLPNIINFEKQGSLAVDLQHHDHNVHGQEEHVPVVIDQMHPSRLATDSHHIDKHAVTMNMIRNRDGIPMSYVARTLEYKLEEVLDDKDAENANNNNNNNNNNNGSNNDSKTSIMVGNDIIDSFCQLFDKYIANSSEHCINISSRMRNTLISMFDEEYFQIWKFKQIQLQLQAQSRRNTQQTQNTQITQFTQFTQHLSSRRQTRDRDRDRDQANNINPSPQISTEIEAKNYNTEIMSININFSDNEINRISEMSDSDVPKISNNSSKKSSHQNRVTFNVDLSTDLNFDMVNNNSNTSTNNNNNNNNNSNNNISVNIAQNSHNYYNHKSIQGGRQSHTMTHSFTYDHSTEITFWDRVKYQSTRLVSRSRFNSIVNSNINPINPIGGGGPIVTAAPNNKSNLGTPGFNATVTNILQGIAERQVTLGSSINNVNHNSSGNISDDATLSPNLSSIGLNASILSNKSNSSQQGNVARIIEDIDESMTAAFAPPDNSTFLDAMDEKLPMSNDSSYNNNSYNQWLRFAKEKEINLIQAKFREYVQINGAKLSQNELILWLINELIQNIEPIVFEISHLMKDSFSRFRKNQVVYQKAVELAQKKMLKQKACEYMVK